MPSGRSSRPSACCCSSSPAWRRCCSGGAFLDYAAFGCAPDAELRYLGILVVEIAVGMAVFGTILLIFDTLTGRQGEGRVDARAASPSATSTCSSSPCSRWGCTGCSRSANLVKKVIGMVIFQTAIYLFFIEGSVRAGAHRPGHRPRDRARPGRVREPAAAPADPHRDRRRGRRLGVAFWRCSCGCTGRLRHARRGDDHRQPSRARRGAALSNLLGPPAGRPTARRPSSPSAARGAVALQAAAKAVAVVGAAGGLGCSPPPACCARPRRRRARPQLGGWPPPFGIEYVLDPLSAFVAMVVTFIGLASSPTPSARVRGGTRRATSRCTRSRCCC
jgi:hypothetical protein